MMQAEKFKCLTNHPMETRLEGLTKHWLKRSSLVHEEQEAEPPVLRQTAPEHTSLLPTRHVRALGNGHNWHQGSFHILFPLWWRHTGWYGKAVPHHGYDCWDISTGSMDPCIHRWVSNERGDHGGAGILVHFPGTQKVSESMAIGKHSSNYRAETEALIKAASIVQASDHDCNCANNLYSSLMPSPSCRHTKTTSSQTWPKPYSKLQLPGGPFCSRLQPTVEYQEMSKQTSLQRRVPEENSMPTMSASVKRRLIRALTMPTSQRDDYHLLSRKQQVILVRLRTGHNRLNSHMIYICTANWSWHPYQPAPVVKKNKPQSTLYKDAPFTKLQEKTCGLAALPWRPNSKAADQTLRLQTGAGEDDIIHLPSGLNSWSCRLWMPRRRRTPYQISSNLEKCVRKWSKEVLPCAICLPQARSRSMKLRESGIKWQKSMVPVSTAGMKKSGWKVYM